MNVAASLLCSGYAEFVSRKILAISNTASPYDH